MKFDKVKLIFLLFLIIVIIYIYHSGSYEQLRFENVQLNLELIRKQYREEPLSTLGLFCGIYILLASLSIPGTIILTLLAGALFGIIQGTIIVTLCGTVGASFALLMSRYLFRNAVFERFNNQFVTMNNKLKENGKLYLLTLRLLPASPFVVINLLMGLTTLRLWTFIWITFLGMLPGSLIFVYAGRKISEISSPSEIMTWPLILSLTLLGIMPFLVKRLFAFYRRKSDKS